MSQGQEIDHFGTWADVIDWLSLTGLSTDQNSAQGSGRGRHRKRLGRQLTNHSCGKFCEAAKVQTGEGWLTRILEKQNRLQMSQVFSVPVHQPSDGLAFQGFYRAGPRNLRVPDFHISCTCTHQSETQTQYAARGDLPRPLTNFGPAKARPLHNRRRSQPDHASPRSRWSEARPR